VIRVVLLASLNNGYVGVNRELVNRMRKLGALSKPLTLAIDWHDVMYYGDHGTEGVVGTQPKRGIETSYKMIVGMFHAKTTSKLYSLRILHYTTTIKQT